MSTTQRENELPRKRVLAPATPSPRKRKHVENLDFQHIPSETFRRPTLPLIQGPGPSNILSALKIGQPDDENERANEHKTSKLDIIRDSSDMTIIERLKMGPYQFSATSEDPTFDSVEPHSSIRLVRRLIPHNEVSDFLTGRYYLSPSLLYSIARLSANRQGYELPLDGEWVTIAVVAERGDVKLSSSGQSHTLINGAPQEGQISGESLQKAPKKYIAIKLIDFSAQSRINDENNLRGDAFLNLMLFEADSMTTVQQENSSKSVNRTYSGGSGGAFENSARFSEGCVIAICSPRLLRPYKSSGGNDVTVHPRNNILGITPTSPSSIIIIGKSRDLGQCTAKRRDGQSCGSWCDRRVSAVCDYHLQEAVKSRRAARPEFAIGTTGFSREPKSRVKPQFDPIRKHGLLPIGPQAIPSDARNSQADTGAMYIIGDQVIKPSRGGGDEFVFEKLGREREAKLMRQKGREEEEERLNSLLKRDGGLSNGAKALAQIRNSKTPQDASLNPKGIARTSRGAFSAEALKNIGFDPSANKRPTDAAALKRKVELLGNIQASSRHISLQKPPTQREKGHCLDVGGTGDNDDDDSDLEFVD